MYIEQFKMPTRILIIDPSTTNPNPGNIIFNKKTTLNTGSENFDVVFYTDIILDDIENTKNINPVFFLGKKGYNGSADYIRSSLEENIYEKPSDDNFFIKVGEFYLKAKGYNYNNNNNIYFIFHY